MGIQFKKSVLEMLVLSLIHQSEYTAYQIEEHISNSIKIPEGSIYPILQQLSTNDYIYNNFKIDELGNNKKMYYLTDKGLTYYMQLTGEWSDLTNRINTIIKEDCHD